MDNNNHPELNPQPNDEVFVSAEDFEIPEEPETSDAYTPLSPFADSPYEMEDEPAYQQAPQPRATKPKKKNTGKKFLKGLLCAVLIAALVAGSCAATAYFLNSYWNGVNQINQDRFQAQLEQLEQQLQQQIDDNSFTGNGNSISGTPNTGIGDGLTPAQVYSQNVKSVVAISNQVTTNIYGQVSETASSGTGFIISEDGYIVSNYHVVEGATTLTVITWDGTEYTARYVGGDEPNDLAVLKIEATGLQTAKLGSSDDLIVGDMVVAIGNPLGELTSTLTVGYVSAKDRDINTSGALINMIQTDAAINPGNSGGPLFNMKGEVIGITTAKYSGTTTSGASIEGIGFAIPMDDVINKITDLRDVGYITGAYLGVMVQDTDPSLSYYGIPMGAFIREVTKGSCAETAGVLAKDIIVAIGDHEVGGLNDLSKAMQTFKAGDETTITVWRSGQYLELKIILDAKPASTETTP